MPACSLSKKPQAPVDSLRRQVPGILLLGVVAKDPPSRWTHRRVEVRGGSSRGNALARQQDRTSRGSIGLSEGASRGYDWIGPSARPIFPGRSTFRYGQHRSARNCRESGRQTELAGVTQDQTPRRALDMSEEASLRSACNQLTVLAVNEGRSVRTTGCPARNKDFTRRWRLSAIPTAT